jgi:hypothetical protein
MIHIARWPTTSVRANMPHMCSDTDVKTLQSVGRERVWTAWARTHAEQRRMHCTRSEWVSALCVRQQVIHRHRQLPPFSKRCCGVRRLYRIRPWCVCAIKRTQVDQTDAGWGFWPCCRDGYGRDRGAHTCCTCWRCVDSAYSFSHHRVRHQRGGNGHECNSASHHGLHRVCSGDVVV